MTLRNVCVFCGSSNGNRPVYAESARRLGTLLAARGLGVVYGGAHCGLMGALADAALSAGGRVIGVIPEALQAKEIAHTGLTELRVVATMHERKALMAELADAFIALPGGFGTLDEFCEILTWAQLGIHRKPCGLLNLEGYYDPLLRLFDHAVGEGLLRRANRDMVIAETSIEALLERIHDAPPPAVDKWIDPRVA